MFALGLSLISLLLEKLDSSFWLISSSLNSPTELFTIICSKNWYKQGLILAKDQTFTENRLSGDEIINQFIQSEGISTIFNNVVKQSAQPHLFCWFLPLLKTISEFENYFVAMIKEMTSFLLQICGKNLYFLALSSSLLKTAILSSPKGIKFLQMDMHFACII